jgi:hypothetical protein
MSMHLYFPCGIIRGALSNLGIPCAVSADISSLPACASLSLSHTHTHTQTHTHKHTHTDTQISYLLL